MATNFIAASVPPQPLGEDVIDAMIKYKIDFRVSTDINELMSFMLPRISPRTPLTDRPDIKSMEGPIFLAAPLPLSPAADAVVTVLNDLGVYFLISIHIHELVAFMNTSKIEISSSNSESREMNILCESFQSLEMELITSCNFCKKQEEKAAGVNAGDEEDDDQEDDEKEETLNEDGDSGDREENGDKMMTETKDKGHPKCLVCRDDVCLCNHCVVCKKYIPSLSELVAHLRSHFEPTTFPCDICGKHLAHAYNMKRHKMIHTGVKPFNCPECDKCFGQKQALSTHRLRIHGVTKRVGKRRRK